ncbi:MAG: LL-diaminopimelate aminotransferase [Chloroflexota bacterium]
MKAERLSKLPPYLFVQIRNKIRDARERGVDVISLGVGDPDQPTPRRVVDALCEAARDPANHPYPTDEEKGMLAYRKTIADWYRRRFAVELEPETEVLGLIGSKEGNHHLCLGMLNPGDVAILPDPGYPAYFASAVFAGAEVVRVPLFREKEFRLDVDDIPADVLDRTRLIFLCYPNNPTAAVATPEFYQRVVDFCREHNILVVNDNPYSEITYDGYKAPSILAARGAMDVAVEFNSLSKPFNMTGWRIGMAMGNREAISAISQVKENTDSGVFNAIQYAAIAALNGPQEELDQLIAMYKRRRDMVVTTFRAMGLDVDVPKGTFYVWTPTPQGMKSADFAEDVLERTGVVVTPGLGYGSRGEGFFRVSLTVPDARLEEALERLKKAYA